MKKITAAIVGLLLIPFIAMADGKRIPFEKLPAEARTFVNTYFGGSKILQVTAEWDEYDVLFADLSSVEFDRSGNWKQVKCKKGGAIPEAIIPTRILSYVKEAFPDQLIVKIERSRWGYEVEIQNGLELEFDKNCSFVRIDD